MNRALENIFVNGCRRGVGSGHQELWKFSQSQTLVPPLVGGMVFTATHRASASDLNGAGTKLDKKNIGEPLLQSPLLRCAQNSDSDD